jgi:hypothetical protein
MLEELRLSPRSPGARSWGRSPGGRTATDSEEVKRSLSTGFAEGCGAESTALGAGTVKRREVMV